MLLRMFQTVLKDIVENTEGGLAGLLMDFEGIAVDSYSKEASAIDINVIGAELSVVVKSIARATEMLEAGEPAEVAIQAEKVTTIIRIINETYFIAFTLAPGGNIGKARYMLRSKMPVLVKELS